jgi:hypothetical protein
MLRNLLKIRTCHQMWIVLHYLAHMLGARSQVLIEALSVDERSVAAATVIWVGG